MNFFFFFNTLLIWLPWRTKIKSVLNKLKVNKKISCNIFFFFGGGLFLFCYCLVWYWSIGKWCVSIRKHFSLEAANFSLFSQEGEVTSPLIPGPAWTLRLQFTKYQQRYAPVNFFIFLFFYFFFVIPLTVYIQSIELCRSQFMCYILLLAMVV